MSSAPPAWLLLPAARDAAAQQRYGVLLRLARTAAGLTLAQAGQLTGYSAATLSRLERGVQPLTDVRVLRRFATALGIPLAAFGLTDTPQIASTHTAAEATSLVNTDAGQGGPVRRRQFLSVATAVAAAPWLDTTSASESSTRLESLLSAGGSPTQRALSLTRLAGALNTAWQRYDACSYDELVHMLPELISTIHTSRDAATGRKRERLSAQLASTYRLASELCVKLNRDAMAWVLADRALTAAWHGGDPTGIATCTRAVAIAMRRAGHHDGAVSLLTTTATDLDAERGRATPDTIAAYGTLLCTAAYSSAQNDRRAAAVEFIDEAGTAASRLAAPAHSREGSLSAANVDVYRIGIFTALGDTPAALDSARAVDPRRLPTPERYARYCIDTARAWQHHGRPDRAGHALFAAERRAPQEVRRPSVRRLVSSLLYAPGSPPSGFRDFAGRIGATPL